MTAIGRTLRVGIIGTGRAGQSHAAAFARLDHVTVAGLWNRTRSRAEQLAATLEQPDVVVHQNWRDLVRRPDLDIISIATPPMFRLEPFAEALTHQRHVLVEKPLSVGLTEAKQMASLARQADTVTAISFNWRYSPAAQTALRGIRTGQIGQLRDIRTEWRLRHSPLVTLWSGGAQTLREAGSHELDRLRFWTGWRFEKVVAAMSAHSAFVLAQMEGGPLASLRVTVTNGQPERRITICADQGTLTLTSDWITVQSGPDSQETMTLSNEVGLVMQHAGVPEPVSLEPAEPDRQPPDLVSGQHTWNRLIADFVTAVRRGDLRHESVPHLPHVADGLAVQQVISACERSDTEQRWVNLVDS